MGRSAQPLQTHTIFSPDGVRLHVEETGPRAGRPILFIHGFSQCRLAWRAQLASDLADEFRLVALDCRGHGLSDKPPDAYNEARFWAGDIHAVIEQLGLEQPLLCGWSYGGVVICDYLSQYGDEAIGGVHLIGAATQVGTDAMRGWSGPEFLRIIRGLFSTDAEESVRHLQTLVRLTTHTETALQDFYFMLGYSVITPPYVRRGMFSRRVAYDDVLADLRKPALITHGEQDPIVLVEAARHHQRVIPNARLSVYEGVGHSPFLEDSARFNRELGEFVDGL